MKLVSVIVPYFKKRIYIKNTIKSILNQTYKKFEIIIIYDDSDLTDLEYIKKIKSLDKRIRIIINKNNKGAGYSRNIGIKNSKGSLIAFLDSDDLWKKNKLKKQLNFMKINNLLISSTTYSIFNDYNDQKKIRQVKKISTYKELLKSCDIGLSTTIIDKKILKKKYLFPDLTTKEDYVLWLKISRDLTDIHGLQEILTMWRNSKNSLSSNFFQKIFDGFKVYNVYMKFNWIKSLYYLLILSINYIKKSK
jgi:teichuronic acid biosynthesis glycosyltransferase TuaG